MLCTSGLKAEAKIARRAGFAAIVGAGDYSRTVALVEEAAPKAGCIVSFGIAGALAPGLRAGDVILSCEVIDDGGHRLGDDSMRVRVTELAAQLGAIEGPVLGARMAVATEADKIRAWRETGAIAVDLESAVVARTAAASGIPFLVLRAIADPAQRELPPAALLPLAADGRPAIAQVIRSVLRQPSQISELIGLSREVRRALTALAEPAHALHRLLAMG